MPTIPNSRDLPQRDLTIYLLVEDLNEETVVAQLRDFTEHRIRAGRANGRLFIRPDVKNRRPKWSAIFEDQLDAKAFGLVASVSAVFLLRVSGRLFALTFGGGRHLLDDHWVEDRFGFLAVLNLVHAENIRSVDKQSLDAIGRQTRVQTARGTSVREFGLDYERDLVRAVVGRPNEEDLGGRVTGTSALRTSVRVDLPNLPRLLAKYLDESNGQGYRRKFPGIDQLSVVRDREQLGALDEQVLHALARADLDTFSLAIPEIVDWQRVSVFRFDGLDDDSDHYELRVDDLVRLAHAVGREWVAEDLDRVHIRVLDDEPSTIRRWSLRKCLYGQIRYKGRHWVLSSGTWYSVSNDLVAEVNQDVAAIERIDGLPEFGHPTEAHYCVAMAHGLPEWTVMDRRPIVFGGGKSSVEFCDLFNLRQRTLLHVKRYAGSAPLSHLFQQALVSGETFKTVPEFRRLVNEKLPQAHRLLDHAVSPDDFTIVLGIVKAGQFALPFFSKVTLRNTVRLLRGFNYRVALAHIPVTNDRAAAAVARRRRANG